MLESVEEFVQAHGMAVADSCPSIIPVAGKFLDRSSLREGRVGDPSLESWTGINVSLAG